jgi:hypothetical protein
VLSEGCAVQAMEKDGGSRFKCADSSAWRKDCTCGTASDFMTAGEKYGYGQIPAVTKGFVRLVFLTKINEPSARAQYRSSKDRIANYIYCGDATTVPDTKHWTPHCAEFTAAMARSGGGNKRSLHSVRAQPNGKSNSVEECLELYPLLKGAGVTLDDFSFTRSPSVSLGLPPLPAALPAAAGPSVLPGAASSGPAVKRKAALVESASDDEYDEPLIVRQRRLEAGGPGW